MIKELAIFLATLTLAAIPAQAQQAVKAAPARWWPKVHMGMSVRAVADRFPKAKNMSFSIDPPRRGRIPDVIDYHKADQNLSIAGYPADTMPE